MSRLGFQIQAQASGSRARAGRFRTLHGEVLTPLFMPVGTKATVRSQTFETVTASGSQVLLANTYHLLLRPGLEVFEKFGGIHKFMNWNGSVLTDSGGYQVFSLPNANKISEEGAAFRSYIDGRRILLSPEESIRAQKAIGSDIMMVMDHCVPSTSDFATAQEAAALTARWAERSLAARGDSLQSMFGIVQGAVYPKLRRASARAISSLPFDGLAVGGLAVGEGKSEREDMVAEATAFLPQNLPRYLMGVGTPIDLLEAVHRGIDMFDCILPTALAQQGVAWTARGKLDFRRGVYRLADETLEPGCDCPACSRYSMAYLHHLTKSEEVLGWHLIGAHNLHFFHRLMREIRASILEGTFESYYATARERLASADLNRPPVAETRVPKERKKVLGQYELAVSEEGFGRIRHRTAGEMMHPSTEPTVEAVQLYVEQSRLVERLSEPGEPLVVWDVGLGAATNAMAAIRAVEAAVASGRCVRQLHIVSFENDLDSLRLALLHPKHFSHIRHSGPQALLKNRTWTSKDGWIQWDLLEGDFSQAMRNAPKPEIVFYDPFSYKVDAPLWTLEAFQALSCVLAGAKTWIYTYSASTRARAFLLASGFYVRAGRGTGLKRETTVALTPAAAAQEEHQDLLGQTWIEKLARSGAPLTPEVRAAVEAHSQFLTSN